MPITIDCPRCKKPLAVPRKKAGSYVRCPECAGRLWVPPDAAGKSSENKPGGSVEADQGSMDTSSVSTIPPAPGPPSGPIPAAPPPQSAPLSPGGPPVAPPTSRPQETGPQQAVPVPPHRPGAPLPTLAPSSTGRTPQPPTPGRQPLASPKPPSDGSGSVSALRGPGALAPGATAAGASQEQLTRPKTARFIPAQPAESSLRVAEDGTLPQLQLRESNAPRGGPQEPKGSNPWLVFVAVGLSALASVFLLLTDPAAPPASLQEEKANARWRIEEEYFANLNSADPLKPYQLLLREAQQAHSRGDWATEREKYREVLALLREERAPFERGLTGSRRRDKALEELITVLLASN